MSHHLRYQSTQWATHHVVSRCLQGFAFLQPRPEIVAICRGVLGYSLHMHQETIKLHHYVFLSNHFHLLLSSEDTPALAKFMCHFKSNLARELARVHDWHGTLWQGRYSSEQILDEEGLKETFKYITQNSVKEGLVNHPSQWKGLHGHHQLVGGEEVSGPWVDRTKLYWALQRREEVTEKDVTKYYAITLTPPPMWSELEVSEYQELCKTLSDEAIAEAQAKRKSASMGMKRVLAQPVFKSRFTKRSTRPLCRTKCIERLKSYKHQYYEFKSKFQEASAALRASLYSDLTLIQIHFPWGGVPLFGGYVAPS